MQKNLFIAVLIIFNTAVMTAWGDRSFTVPLNCYTPQAQLIIYITNPSAIDQSIQIEVIGREPSSLPPSMSGGLLMFPTYQPPTAQPNIDFDMSDPLTISGFTYYKKATLKATKRTVPAGETRFFGIWVYMHSNTPAGAIAAANKLGGIMKITVTGDSGYLLGQYDFCDNKAVSMLGGRAF